MDKIKVNLYGEEYELTPQFFLYDVKNMMGEKMNIPGIDLTYQTAEGEEPFATLTVSFGEFISIKNAAYIDTNNCPFADAVLKAGLATDTGLTKQSGFCTYPLWLFDEDFLKEIGGEEYEEYSQAFEQYMHGDDEPAFTQLM